MENRLCTLEDAKLIVGDNYILEWFLAPAVWPIYLLIYLIFNVVDKTYIKSQERKQSGD